MLLVYLEDNYGSRKFENIVFVWGLFLRGCGGFPGWTSGKVAREYLRRFNEAQNK